MRLENWGDEHGGQWNKNNIYCPECHAFDGIPHKEGCKTAKVKISATARIPRKNASEKIWAAFYKKFVLQVDLKKKLKELNIKHKKQIRRNHEINN